MIPSTLQFIFPDLYVGIYKEGVAGMTIEQVQEINPSFYEIMRTGFQGIGVTVIGILGLSVPILFIPFRRKEKWAWYSLVGCWGFMWLVNLVMELKSSEELWTLIYSPVALILIILGAIFSYLDISAKSSANN
jgi:hypothetical protein